MYTERALLIVRLSGPTEPSPIKLAQIQNEDKRPQERVIASPTPARTHTARQQVAARNGNRGTNQWAQVEVATAGAAAGSEPASAAAAMALAAGTDGQTDRALLRGFPDRAGERRGGAAGMAWGGGVDLAGGWPEVSRKAGGKPGEFGEELDCWRRLGAGGCVIRERGENL
jgi:hypothetical protein